MSVIYLCKTSHFQQKSDVFLIVNDKKIKTNWYTAERILVSISSSPQAGKVIRYGARIAQKYKCDFYVISIEPCGPFTKGFSSEDWKVIEKHENLAENLGAEVFRLKGRNISKKILEFAAQKRITQIVLGHSSRKLFTRLFKGSIINEIIENSKETEIRIVPWKKM